ncbi:hypothetical protein [Bifidobacterium asteroides]|uniref:hypothetical protein n=1 Tax=Bifidobacterium asteroides TaxID=1684 RepID=UPI003A8111B5
MNTTTSLQDDVKQLSQDHQLMLTAGRQALDSIMRILDGTHQPEAIGHDRLTRMAALIETSLPHRDALLVAAINPDTTRDDLTTITEQPHDPAAVKLIFTSLTTCFEGRTPVNQERADRAYNLFDQLTAAVGPTPHLSASRAYLAWAARDPDQASSYMVQALTLDRTNNLAALIALALSKNINPTDD